jgi:glycosyltransferase involved in cell wall biosynthesis
MRNISIFVPTLMKGGTEKQCLLLAKSLKEKYNVYIVVLNGNLIDIQNKEFLLKNQITYISLKGILIVRIIDFFKVMKKNRIEIIFAYLASCNFIAATIGRLAGVNFIFGGIRNSVFSHHKLLIQKLLHNYSLDYSISNNYIGVNNLIKKGFEASKFIVIPNYIEHNNNLSIRIDRERKTILTVGRFVPSKDYYTSLLSIKHLIMLMSENGIKIKYNIIGYGPLHKSVINWISELDLENYVDIIINPDNLSEYYENSDIFLSCSIFEGLSNAIMEAMSFSLPIIATDVGDNNRLVINGENGFVVKPKDYATIAGKLLYLINNNNLRIDYGKRSFNIINENYNLNSFKKSYVDLISRLSK